MCQYVASFQTIIQMKLLFVNAKGIAFALEISLHKGGMILENRMISLRESYEIRDLLQTNRREFPVMCLGHNSK